MIQIFNQMIRAAKLDSSLYEEVESNTDALLPAMTVILISSIAAGIGTIPERGPSGIVIGTLTALISWFIWSFSDFLSEQNSCLKLKPRQIWDNCSAQSASQAPRE